LSFQLVSPTSLHDRAKTMIEFEAEYDGKPLVCSISRRVLEQLGNRDGASTEELLKLFEEHRPTIAAMVRKKYEVGVVDFVGKDQPKLAGLYAEGRVETKSTTNLTIPATAIWRDGDTASAWRITQDKVNKVAIALGERDPRTGDYVLKSGLQEGDRVIRYPSAMLKDGQPVQASAPAPTSMASEGK